MNHAAAFTLCSVPLFIFLSSGIVEFRRDRHNFLSLPRLLPIAFAVFVSILLLVDLPYSFIALHELSRTMSALSLLFVLPAFFCRYKSRVAAGLMLVGGIVLAYFWLITSLRA